MTADFRVQENMIQQFRGEHAFLSNFYLCSVLYNGITFTNTEAAFQAQKTTDPEQQKAFADLSPAKAKSAGRRVTLRADWENVKFQIMYEVCRAKFTQHPELAKMLLDTGDALLVEGNHWGDKVWGQVKGEGQNRLGQILMRIRNELRNHEV